MRTWRHINTQLLFITKLSLLPSPIYIYHPSFALPFPFHLFYQIFSFYLFTFKRVRAYFLYGGFLMLLIDWKVIIIIISYYMGNKPQAKKPTLEDALIEMKINSKRVNRESAKAMKDSQTYMKKAK